MSDGSTIEWTQATWNPVTGCDRTSPGCDHCYALTLAKRLKAMGAAKYQNDGDPRTSGPGFGVTVHPDALDIPRRWRTPRHVFVNSMSDLFHAHVPDDFIAQVLAVMAATPQHTYQLLTKRPRRMRRLLNSPEFADLVFDHADSWDTRQRLVRPTPDDPMPTLPHVWLGVSVEDQKRAEQRIPELLGTPAAVHWISAEPLIGPINLDIWTELHCPWNYTEFGVLCMCGEAMRDDVRCYGSQIDWVVAGGESGRDHRPVDVAWLRDIRGACTAAGVPFFFKQWGGIRPKAGGRVLDGRTWDQMPTPRAAVPA